MAARTGRRMDGDCSHDERADDDDVDDSSLQPGVQVDDDDADEPVR